MKNKTFCDWWIVAVCMLIMGTIFSLRVYCLSLFQVPVTQDLGITRSQFSGISVIASIVGMVLSPFAGKLLERHSIRYFMALAAAACALSFASLSLAGSALHLYISSVIMGVSYIFLTSLPITILMNRWFEEKRSTMISLTFVGASFGTVLLSPAITRLIGMYGWRSTFQILGLFFCVLLVPLILFVVRDYPEEKRETDLGSGEAGGGGKQAHGEGVPLAMLIKTSEFWLFTSGISVAVLTLGCLHHMPAFVMDIGFSAEIAALSVSVYSFVAIFGKLASGVVFDRFGLNAGVLLGMVNMLLTFLFLYMARSIPMLVMAAACYGFGGTCGTILPPVMTSKLFGNRYYGENYGLIYAFVTLCLGVNNLLFAIGYDLTGSYTVSWVGGAVLSVFAAVLLILAARKCRFRIPETEYTSKPR